jgi:hypothetical protein
MRGTDRAAIRSSAPAGKVPRRRRNWQKRGGHPFAFSLAGPHWQPNDLTEFPLFDKRIAHPIQGDLSLWGYRSGSCPVVEKAARELVNLPTDPDMSRGEVERVKAFVRRHAEDLLAAD